MTSERLTEVSILDRATRIDREAGVIHGVRIVAAESQSGRRYPAATLAKARSLFEGAKVNFEVLARGASRKSEDRLGVLRNVRQRDDGGLEADIHYLTSHPMAERVCEAIERGLGGYALQLDAGGKLGKRDGREIVDEIASVRGIDLIANDGEAGTLLESAQAKSAGGTAPTASPRPSQTTESFVRQLRGLPERKMSLKEFKNPTGDDRERMTLKEFLRDIRK